MYNFCIFKTIYSCLLYFKKVYFIYDADIHRESSHLLVHFPKYPGQIQELEAQSGSLEPLSGTCQLYISRNEEQSWNLG